VSDRRTALVVVLVDDDPVVRTFRQRHDPAATRGIPAHVTIVFPFAPGAADDAGLLAGLAELYAEVAPFAIELARVERFPEHVWLAPEPRERFAGLIERTTARFPDYPPYQGAFAEVIPHLTVGSGEGIEAIDEAARRELAPHLPLYGKATAVTLLEEQPDGTWVARASFPLAAS
jgi:2'-5' RNA ligase